MNPTHGQEAKSMVEPQLPIVPGNSSSNFDLEVPIALEKDVGLELNILSLSSFPIQISHLCFVPLLQIFLVL